MYSDFEKGVHTSINICFPNSLICGCVRHFTNAWFREIQELVLSNIYKSRNVEEGWWLRKIFGLPYLHVDAVEYSFLEDLMAVRPNNDSIIKFCDYLVDTYIFLFYSLFWGRVLQCFLTNYQRISATFWRKFLRNASVNFKVFKYF